MIFFLKWLLFNPLFIAFIVFSYVFLNPFSAQSFISKGTQHKRNLVGHKQLDLTFYKHTMYCVWAITILLTVYFLCCKHCRTNTNDLEVSYVLFLVYYNQLLITLGLIMHSVDWFLFPVVGWTWPCTGALDLLKPVLFIITSKSVWEWERKKPANGIIA
jgi:hypothetical protein